MGKISRTKGRSFEQAIARKLRERWPDMDVRRSSQAERAYNSDVFVTGHPVLESLWLELQDARNPTPAAKIVQAERDIDAGGLIATRAPVVVWHRLGERVVHVTTRLWVLDKMRRTIDPGMAPYSFVTLTFDEFCDIVKASEA